MKQIRVSFRTVTNPTDNPKMFFAHTVDYDTVAKTHFDAVKEIFPDAHYYYKLNPYCLVFYHNQFGYIYSKEFDLELAGNNPS